MFDFIKDEDSGFERKVKALEQIANQMRIRNKITILLESHNSGFLESSFVEKELDRLYKALEEEV